MIKIWKIFKDDCQDSSKTSITSITLDKNSSTEFTFECHPFDQCEEFNMDFYGYKEKDSINIPEGRDHDLQIINLDGSKFIIDDGHSIFYWNNYTVIINTDEIVQYLICEATDKDALQIVSILNDPEMYLQYGDCWTKGYIHKPSGNLIIQNCGDVSSLVIIHNKEFSNKCIFKEQDIKEIISGLKEKDQIEKKEQREQFLQTLSKKYLDIYITNDDDKNKSLALILKDEEDMFFVDFLNIISKYV